MGDGGWRRDANKEKRMCQFFDTSSLYIGILLLFVGGNMREVDTAAEFDQTVIG